MLDSVKWLDRIIDELSHKRRRELYQEWLGKWAQVGSMTYEINAEEIAKAFPTEEAQRAQLASEELRIARLLAVQMADPCTMGVRDLPSKKPLLRRELFCICFRVKPKEGEAEKTNLIVLPTPRRVVGDPAGVPNPTQPVDELAALDKLLGKFPSESVELRGITKDYMDGVTDGISAVMETPWPATPAADDDDSSEPPPKSAA